MILWAPLFSSYLFRSISCGVGVGCDCGRQSRKSLFKSGHLYLNQLPGDEAYNFMLISYAATQLVIVRSVCMLCITP